MPNRERTGERDLSVNMWHRVMFGDNATAIDLDLMGLCQRCGAHLYVWEDTRSWGHKPVKITRDSAMRLNCPGLLIRYEFDEWTETFTRWEATRIFPRPELIIGGEIETHSFLAALREHHERLWHSDEWGGLS